MENANDLTMNDLQVMVRVITAGTQRGMYRPEELSTVGALYEKLMGILKQANAVPEDFKKEETTEGDKENA